ncbi:hypothetical protein KR044_012897, partial [Drosophila immigrans]
TRNVLLQIFKHCNKMSGTTQKPLIPCDYCKVEKDGTQMYTGRKQFAGCRIVDILEIVTKVKMPVSTPIKLCAMCVSTLHATTGAIERAAAMVTKLLPHAKIQDAVVAPTKTNNQKVIQINTDDDESEEAEEQQQQPSMEKFNSPSKNMAATNATSTVTVVKKSIDKATKQQQKLKQQQLLQQQQFGTESPSKLDESLNHVIKLTPAAEASSNKSKAFIQLFGNSVNHISDSEEGSEDDEEEAGELKSKKNIAINFECKLCDFTSTFPNPMKRHMRDLHGQKRPRIYNCMKCPKGFGVLKTLKIHLLTHGMVEEKPKQPEQEQPEDPQLAKFKALKPKPKSKSLGNAELTFAIQDTNSSTPKPADGAENAISSLSYPCEICKQPHNSIKSIQKHMTVVHNIEKPKVFKCIACETFFMHKGTLDRHIKVKHGDDQDPTKAKPKAQRRRKTIDERSILQTSKANGAVMIKIPTKIAERRKTVDVSIALAEMNKSRKLSGVFDELDAEVEVTPKKPKKSQTEPINDSNASPTKKVKDNKKNTSVSGTPNLLNGAAIQQSSLKKSKQDQDTDDQIIELLDEINANPIPNRREMLESMSQDSVDGISLSCNQCSKVVSSRKRLDSHIKKKHSPSLDCRKCQKHFTDSNDFVGHFAVCNAVGGLACGVKNCDKAFAAANFLSAHLKKKH